MSRLRGDVRRTVLPSWAMSWAIAAALAGAFVAGCVTTQNATRPTVRKPPSSTTTSPSDNVPTDEATPPEEPRESPGRVPIPDGPVIPPLPSAAPPPSPAPAAPAPPTVHVVLASVTKSGRAPVVVAGAWTLRGAGGAQLAAGSGFRGDLVLDASETRLGTTTLPADGAELIPTTSGDLSVGGLRYPGTLCLARATSGRRTVEIRLDLETYLEGVVVGELPAGYPREAMRAQAIVARTYVLTQDGALAAGGIVVDDTGRSDQEFAGISVIASQRAAVHEAVDSTRGLVVSADGRPIRTWYHSTCGGMTCSAPAVFRQPPTISAAARAKGLQGGVACDACTSSSRYRWKDVKISGDAVVKAAGLTGALEGFVVAETFEGGRAIQFEVRAGGKKARIPAAEFRLSVGPRLLSSTWIDFAVVTKGDLYVSGRGWGHGVGLCQVGAKGYAARGWTAEKIVAFYYPGAELVRQW